MLTYIKVKVQKIPIDIVENVLEDPAPSILDTLMVDDFVDNLPDKLGDTLRLMMEGYSYKEIARKLEITLRAVFYRIKKIRSIYEG